MPLVTEVNRSRTGDPSAATAGGEEGPCARAGGEVTSEPVTAVPEAAFKKRLRVTGDTISQLSSE
jgi:hypothetical protein